MDKKQLIDTLMIAVDNALANLHTATIARITKVNATTVNCRPVINRLVNGQSIALPEFIEVPPLFFQGGSSYTAHPVAVGDYCLLIFTERCFDRWYNGQDFQPPLELRMHDYSDGIAIVGINPLGSALTIPTVIQQTGDTNFDGDHTHQGTMDRTGDSHVIGDYLIEGDLTVDGNIICTGNISAGSFSGLSGGTMNVSADLVTSGEVTASGVNLSTHTHSGVTSGPDNTGAPN